MDEESKYCNEINYIIDSMINIFVDKKRKISFDCEEIYEIPINFFYLMMIIDFIINSVHYTKRSYKSIQK